VKRSRATPLIGLGLIGLVAGFLLEVAAASFGAPIVIPPVTLPVALVFIGVILVVLAWPIRQTTRSRSQAGRGHAETPGAPQRRRVDPFQAMRIAVLAQASSHSGSLLLGGALGITFYLLSRSAVPPSSSLWLAVTAAIGALVLLIAGLVAEHFCVLPPDDEEPDAGGVRA
jgi:hypothetical protein